MRFPALRRSILPVLGYLAFSAALQAQGNQSRPPAVPLVTHNPYFSIWSDHDKLTDGPTVHWTGHPQPLDSLVRVDGKPYRIMGGGPREVPAMDQTSLQVTPTHTTYNFAGGGVAITLTFFTPAFLDDLDVLSRPVTYLTWTAKATDNGQHKVEVMLDANPGIATSYDGQAVTFSRNRTATTEVLSVGTREQAVLNRTGDDLRIDWGYFHLAVPTSEAASTSIAEGGVRSFAQTGTLPNADAMEGAVSTHSAPHLDVALAFDSVGATPVSRHVLLSYTEGYAVQYMQRNLRPYWQRNGMPVSTMLDTAERDLPALEGKGTAFDRDLTADLTTADGEHYAYLCALAYRQSIAAHVLVADVDGQPMMFGKENFSNGSIATVDVMYPAAPIFLFFNPKLIAAQVLPVLEYTTFPNHWRFPFAPHDLGQYPLANGQLYGGGEKTEDDQMPVEESGNLLLLVAAIAHTSGDTSMAAKYWPQLTQWADFLRVHGLKPENQLTTDDFAGHVTLNSNLSLKAIEGLEAYADLARMLHHQDEARNYSKTARSYAAQWMTLAKEGDHYKLAYDTPDTWSQKYNLVWDVVLGYDLFPKSVRQDETKFYLTKMNHYGLPLDSRRDYTKLDWEIWTASLTTDRSNFDAIMDPIYRWLNEGPTRVPLTDWYDTKTGKQQGFQARSVVGGVFMKALSDQTLARKWRERAVGAPAAPAAR